ncbi:hypothetical protein PAE9249_01012 [Paenibacillus sp. CECT 9249]|uniref:hypothetical protein n=1 Tax=Paenibacillus sp. CECT 9249 TaxID=2845385 RepID=UPI001E5B3B0F|nr:hypothetical protein [Paenibacillus sp. CECT 9249]CAH0118523.1 hypothetical protein PAE9249_01012 [Paenibacillus sp. CECT 9249]
METLKYILGQPEYVDGAGPIYPVKLKHYDEFRQCSSVLYYSKLHFNEQFQTFPLLDLLIFGLRDEQVTDMLKRLFCLVLRKNVEYIELGDKYAFLTDDGNAVRRDNYDEIRKIVMRQNLLFEQKIYRNELTQAWANKVLQAKAKQGVNITLEDMVTTVSAITGKSYDQLAEQTIYQLHADFKRIAKDKDYQTSIAMMCAGADQINVRHFAEQIDLFENPYDALFVGKERLTQLDRAMSQ